MEKKYLCDISEEESLRILDINEMISSLKSLALVIAENNAILKEHSELYQRLISDYKENLHLLNSFWQTYLDKYSDIIPDNSQLTLDFHNNQIFIMPINMNI